MSPVKAMIIIGCLLAVGIVLTVIEASITPPPEWLIGWTGWIAGVIGAVATLRMIWLGIEALQFSVRKSRLEAGAE